MSSWFSGLVGNEVACTPQTGGQTVERLNIPDAQSRASVRASGDGYDAHGVSGDGESPRENPLDYKGPQEKSIPGDIKLAFQRTNAMCRAMIQAAEARLSTRLDKLEEGVQENQEMISANRRMVTANKDLISANQGKLKSLSSKPGIQGAAPPPSQEMLEALARSQEENRLGFNKDSVSLDSFKDDVQTVIDAMRLELQKQRAVLSDLEGRVELGALEGVFEQTSSARQEQGFVASLFGAAQSTASNQNAPKAAAKRTAGPPGVMQGLKNYVTLQDFQDSLNELNEAVKKDMSALNITIADMQRGMYDKETARGFHEAVEKEFQEIRKGIVNMKTNQELVAVKAGFLAVAATECNHDEKGKLFASLQDQEQECHRKAIFSGTQNYSQV